MKPIFIGGTERSGTTMLGAMLGAHPYHLCPPEMSFKMTLLRHGQNGQLLRPELIRSALAKEAKAEVQGWSLAETQWGTDSPSASEYILEIVEEYGRRHGKAAARVWVDHTPSNLRWAAALSQTFGDASFVHIVRDGRAVAASLMRVEWGPNTIQRATHHWLRGLGYGLAAESGLGGRCVRVRFEDLVMDPETHIRRVCTATGIDFHPAMLTGSGYSANAFSRRQHQLVGKAPVKERASAWKSELTSREVEIFESLASDQLALLGYEPVFGITASPATARERWLMEAQDLLKRRFLKRFLQHSRVTALRNDQR